MVDGIMKRLSPKIILISFLLAGSFTVLLAVGWLFFALSMPNPRDIRETYSPTGLGKAVLVTDYSLRDSDTTCYAIAGASRFEMMVNFDYHFTESSDMHSVTWSRDGSLVAVRATLYVSDEVHNIDRPREYGQFFTGAYDFKQHRALSFGPVRPLSRQIKQLMQQRGGELPYQEPKRRPLTGQEEKQYPQ